MSNSENTQIGADFQDQVFGWFCANYSLRFDKEKAIAIGKPAREHCFDIANEDNSIVIECKCYTWTKSGGVPHGKIRTLNEAAFFFSFLTDTKEKYIVMKKDVHPTKNISLARYYFERYGHLLMFYNIILAEFDPDVGENGNLEIIQ